MKRPKPAWHAKAKELRARGMSLSGIAIKCKVSPQAVSIALDPKKQARRREYVRKWNQETRADPEGRARHRKLDRESHRRRRAAAKE